MTWRGTPGPWKADTNHGCKSIKGPPIGHRQPRSELACTTGLWDDAEDMANAKGMAAVPQLVQALLSVRDDANGGDSYTVNNVRVAFLDPRTLQEIDAALKAAGVTP
jgi:hypothetical protein